MLWVDQESEFYNQTFDKWLDDNEIECYSTYNEGKAVVIERFNRTLKGKMWRYFSANNTNVYLDVLPKLINDYNNSKHRTIKMSPAEASNKKNESKVWNNLYGEIMAITKAKFKIGDKVHISKYKRMFEKGYTPNWTEEVFIIDKILQTNPITYELKYLNNEPVDGSFYDKELQKTTQEVFRIEKVLRRDYKNKLALVKWKGYPLTAGFQLLMSNQ